MSKIFCIGFHKTGTKSLGTALDILGYRVCGPVGVKDPDIAKNVLPLIIPSYPRMRHSGTTPGRSFTRTSTDGTPAADSFSPYVRRTPGSTAPLPTSETTTPGCVITSRRRPPQRE